MSISVGRSKVPENVPEKLTWFGRKLWIPNFERSVEKTFCENSKLVASSVASLPSLRMLPMNLPSLLNTLPEAEHQTALIEIRSQQKMPMTKGFKNKCRGNDNRRHQFIHSFIHALSWWKQTCKKSFYFELAGKWAQLAYRTDVSPSLVQTSWWCCRM